MAGPGVRASDGPIVVGVDGSVTAERAVEWGAREALARGSRLVVLHAPVFRPEFEHIYPQTEGIEHQILDAAVGKARSLTHGTPVEVEGVLGEPPAAAALIRASRTAEMVVVGARGEGGWPDLRLGSVSLEVVRHAHCPVLVVPRTRS